MKNLIIVSILLNLCSCKKTIDCKQDSSILSLYQRNSLQCDLFDQGFLIKSQYQIDKLKDSLPCSTFNDYAEPLNFNKTWMIGYSSRIKFDRFKTDGNLYKDTCQKLITYKYILTEDTTSLNIESYNGTEIRYCLIPAFPSDYKVVYTKEVRYEKLP